MKKVLKHGSTLMLIAIILILIVPEWRVSFQGWFQGIFMGDITFRQAQSSPIPGNLYNWEIKHSSGTSSALADFSDQPVILSFWATWCPPCRAELKELNALKTTLNSAVHFISVSEESPQKVNDSGLTEGYDFLYTTNRFPDFFQVEAYPTLCLLDKGLTLIFQHSGAGGLDNEKNRRFLKDLSENQ